MKRLWYYRRTQIGTYREGGEVVSPERRFMSRFVAGEARLQGTGWSANEKRAGDGTRSVSAIQKANNERAKGAEDGEVGVYLSR